MSVTIFVSTSKPAPGTRHIVDDDHIQVFAHQLILSMRNHIIGFRRKTDEYLTFPLLTSERRSHIGIFNQRKGHRLPALLFNLLRRNFLCAVIRRRGSLNQNVLFFYKRARFVQQLLRRRKRYKLYALWGKNRNRAAQQRNLRASSLRRLCDGIAILPEERLEI